MLTNQIKKILYDNQNDVVDFVVFYEYIFVLSFYFLNWKRKIHIRTKNVNIWVCLIKTNWIDMLDPQQWFQMWWLS